MPKSHNQRFPNKHTRPDLNDELTQKVRTDSKAIFGIDPLEEVIDTTDYIERLRQKHTTPEYQRAAAENRADDEARLARQRDIEQRRMMEGLSPFHVDSIRSGCDGELKPLTTTEIQRKVMDRWDGVQSLFLLGKTGVGKTYTATWCAMKAIRAGKSATSTTALRVVEASPERLAALRSVGVLVLDQLHTLRSPAGTDMPAWQVLPVVDLIDCRYERMLTTIGAGKVDPVAMVDLLGDDVQRRFPLRLSSDSTQVRK